MTADLAAMAGTGRWRPAAEKTCRGGAGRAGADGVRATSGVGHGLQGWPFSEFETKP